MKHAEATPRDAIEFLPDAQEILQEHLPWYLHTGIIWPALILIAVIVWACLGKVDIIVRAKGKFVSDKGDIVMKPRESSIIKSIDVQKGDIVNAGDVLITFDPTLNQAEVDRYQREIIVLTAERDRWQAEYDNRTYVPASPDEENCRWQLSIFKQRQAYYNEKINYFDSNANRIQAAIQSTHENHEKYSEILANLAKIEAMYTELQKNDAASAKEVLEVVMQRLEGEAEVSNLKKQLVDYQQQLLATHAEKAAFMEEWRNTVSEKLVETGRELDSNRKQLIKAQSLVSYVKLCAPCKAVVHDIASFPIGSAVGEAEAIITLVPLDGRLEIEAEIQPQDIAHVNVMSAARIKLNAFPFQKHGTLDGSVRNISQNTFTRQAADTPITYYRATVTVSGALKNLGKASAIFIPGMEAEVEIKAGKRRLIDYFLHPLIKGLDEAFTEP